MDYEQKVQHFFETLGYSVKKIAESDISTPDFLVTGASSKFVVELKTKYPSSKDRAERLDKLNSGTIHIINESVVRNNTLSGIISDASDQLASCSEENVLRLCWLFAIDFLADPRIQQFEATLFGKVPFISSERKGDCYFYSLNDFYRYRYILDGAIVSTETDYRLLLNSLSPRYPIIKSSSLSKHSEFTIIDPVEEEKSGKAILADCDIDHRDERAVDNYLCMKYQLTNFAILNMTYLSVTKQFKV